MPTNHKLLGAMSIIKYQLIFFKVAVRAFMVEETGLEPARSNEQQILSLWRLPITPLLHKSVLGQGATPDYLAKSPFKHSCSYTNFAGYSLDISIKDIL